MQATRMKVREKRSVSTHTQREMADKVVVMLVVTGDDDGCRNGYNNNFIMMTLSLSQS